MNGYCVLELGLRGMLRYVWFVYVVIFFDWSYVRVYIKFDILKC